MKPMGINSTPFLTLSQIETKNIDLFEDAFGLYATFTEVIALIETNRPEPDERLIISLLEKIRNQ